MKRIDYDISIGNSSVLIGISDTIIKSRYQWNECRHSNATYELHIVLNGSCTLDVETETLLLKKGTAVLIPPGQFHTTQKASGPFERFSLSIGIQNFKTENQFLCAFPQSRIFSIDAATEQICKIIFDEITRGELYRKDMLKSQLTILLIHIARLLELPVGIETDCGADMQSSWTDIVDAFFEKNLTNNGTENELAKCLHLSRRQLNRILQKEYGMSFRQKMLCARMDQAGYLIRTTDKSITEICQLAGYRSESAFYKVFKEYYHMSPIRYRRYLKSKS